MKKRSINTSMVWLWLRMAHQKTASFIKKNKSSERMNRDAAGRNEQVAHGEATCDQLCPRDKLMA
jgi:hypothetical protein